jgi:Lipoprotein amino terminal region
MRNSDGTFLQGYSGNPTGRPAVISELQKLARTHTPTALATLVEIMSNTANPPNARVSAAVALLDRGYGRPSTAVFVEMTQQVSSAEREALLTTVVTAMDEMAASTRAAEKRAMEAEQRVLELESAGSRRQH